MQTRALAFALSVSLLAGCAVDGKPNVGTDITQSEPKTDEDERLTALVEMAALRMGNLQPRIQRIVCSTYDIAPNRLPKIAKVVLPQVGNISRQDSQDATQLVLPEACEGATYVGQ